MHARRVLTLAAGLVAAFLADAGTLPTQTRSYASDREVQKIYFPLQVGNRWVYARIGADGVQSWKVAVTDVKKAPNSHRYFVLNGYLGEAGRLVRRNLHDKVAEFSRRLGADNLWYLLGAPAGTGWVMELAPRDNPEPLADCVDGSRLAIVSRSERIKVPAGTFADVVRIRFHSPCSDAGILEEWFAPGVGLVRRVENTFAGPVVSELVRARVGGHRLPRLPYSTSLAIDRPVYVNNLMPVVGDPSPDAIPVVRGLFAVRNRTPVPAEFVFSGCKSVSIRLRDAAGNVLLRASGNDGGCCECDNIFRFELVDDVLLIPVVFRLAAPDGSPLPDGRYAVEARLDSLGTGSVHPAATADISVRSIH